MKHAHEQHVVKAAVFVDGVSPAPFDTESDAFVHADGLLVLGEDVEFDAVEVHLLKGEPAEGAECVGAVTAAPAIPLSNHDPDFAGAVLWRAHAELDVADEAVVSECDNGRDKVAVARGRSKEVAFLRVREGIPRGEVPRDLGVVDSAVVVRLVFGFAGTEPDELAFERSWHRCTPAGVPAGALSRRMRGRHKRVRRAGMARLTL